MSKVYTLQKVQFIPEELEKYGTSFPHPKI